MGKTWLVKRLRQQTAEWPGEVLELPIDCDEAASPTTASQAWDAFLDLVGGQGKRLFGEIGRAAGAFANELTAARQAQVIGDIKTFVDAKDAKIGASANVGGVEMDDSMAELVLSPKVQRAVSAFVSRFTPLVKRKSALVTIDRFDSIAGSVYARWLLSLLAQLPNTLVVITRSPGAAAPAVAGVATERKQLEPFSREEVGELLACFLPDRTIDPRLVEIVHMWSEGHVFTAALAAQYLRTVDDPDPVAFEARLAALPVDYGEQRVEIELEILRAPGADDLVETVSALAVTRRFDSDLLKVLVDPVPERAIERLTEAGLVEPAGEGLYSVHSFIREPLEANLAPGQRRLLHGRAARYYYALLTADEPELEKSARPYDAWYRYEKPEWQGQLREWLYHNRAAAGTEKAKERARLQFARVFLDAFWWWGCYLPFSFCPDLIADWRRARGDDAEWVEDLQLLLGAYPMGYEKHGAGRWEDVRAALLGVRASCGLEGAAEQLKSLEARHTRGLLENFLAHSLRYRASSSDAEKTKSYEQALVHYERAADLFEKGKETWELAWTLFETAELHADNDRLQQARESWRRAVALAVDEDDWELKANLHRLAADIRWQDGAHASAFDAHGRAILHAYLFQSKTPSRRPDAYTITFYWEQNKRVFERLQAIGARGLEDAVARLAGPFGTGAVSVDAVAAVLATEDHRRLAGLVFPEAPKDDELLKSRSAFTRRVELLAEDAAPERDLEHVEP
jgi:hypothetical protein